MKELFDPQHRLRRRTPRCDYSLPRALLLAQLESDKRHARRHGEATAAIESHIRRITRFDNTWLKEAQDLVRRTGINIVGYSSSQDHLDAFSLTLNEYHIILYTRYDTVKVYTKMWEANKREEKKLYIAFFDNYFDEFTPTRTTINKTICNFCHQEYRRLIHHRCEVRCTACRRADCTGNLLDQPITCPDCNVKFFREGCFESHNVPHGRENPVCSNFKICPDCSCFYSVYNLRNGPHVCGETTYCHTCQRHANPLTHQCCWIPPTQKEKEKLLKKQEKFKILFFDFETVQLANLDNLTDFQSHSVNFVYYTRLCQDCVSAPPESDCDNCGIHKFGSFKWDSPNDPPNRVVRKFIDFLLNYRALDNSICIAHNAGRYDLHFFTGQLLKLGIRPKIITAQRTIKLMLIQQEGFNSLTFKDSFAFTPVALAKLPKAFGFQDQCKGHFPHFWNQIVNYGTVLPHLPAIEYYDRSRMIPAAGAQFDVWYEEHRNDPFNFDQELEKYCRNDVLILHQGIARYMMICQRLTEYNPIIHCTTFASFAALLLRTKHMRPNQIGIIPEKGYISNDVQSKMAVQFIRWLEKEEQVQYQYKMRGNEYRFNCNGRQIRVDAFLPETNTVVEILGCYYHGCPNHTDPNKRHPLYFKSNQQVYAETMECLQMITDSGYNLRVIWEHEITAARKANRELNEFMKKNVGRGRLMIRDAFLGARSQNYRLKARPGPGQKIVHIDQNSQYPYVLCNTEMPQGQPTVITRGVLASDICLPLTYKGFYMVDLLPPRDLLYPVIPWRNPAQDNKLFFTLCRSCAEAAINVPCTHETDEERMLPVVVCHAELELALKKGYKVLDVHEIYHWDHWYTDLFRDFLSTFIKVKMEASGWPRSNMTEEEKDQMINDLFENEGILIDKDNVELNEALRYIAKLIINSSWGKYGERPGKSEIAFYGFDEIPFFLTDETYECLDTQFIGADFIMNEYRKKEEYAPPGKYTSCAIAALTTAGGRMQLYNVMDRVGDRLLYSDTDSAIFITEPGADNLDDLKGPYLGKWQDELPEGFEITEFCSTGSKSYAYRLWNPTTGETREVVKSKGITRNEQNKDQLDYQNLERLVDKSLLIRDFQGGVPAVVNRLLVAQKSLLHHMLKRSPSAVKIAKFVKMFHNDLQNERPLLTTKQIQCQGDLITLVVCRDCRNQMTSIGNKITFQLCESCAQRTLAARFPQSLKTSFNQRFKPYTQRQPDTSSP